MINMVAKLHIPVVTSWVSTSSTFLGGEEQRKFGLNYKHT